MHHHVCFVPPPKRYDASPGTHCLTGTDCKYLAPEVTCLLEAHCISRKRKYQSSGRFRAYSSVGRSLKAMNDMNEPDGMPD